MSTQTPQGWYPDPDAPGYVRWWDGERWTDLQLLEGMQPKPMSKTDAVFEMAGNVGKLILLVLLLLILLGIIYVVVTI